MNSPKTTLPAISTHALRCLSDNVRKIFVENCYTGDLKWIMYDLDNPKRTFIDRS